MKVKPPIWHALLRPYFNWLADRREKREARARLEAWSHVGYFSLIWTYKDRNDSLSVFMAYENGRGKRRLTCLTNDEERCKTHRAWPAMQSWLLGDNYYASWILPNIEYERLGRVKRI